MHWIARPFLETGADFSLSPEHWIASETASQLVGGTLLSEIVQSVAKTQSPPDDARFVLDTGNAREGLLDVTILGNPVSGRSSAKKVVVDGDVNRDAAWTYPDPKPAAAEIRERVAFWRGVTVTD